MKAMDCSSVRTQMLSARRGQLSAHERELVREHLAGCEACQRADAHDAALDELLRRLPRAPAPEALRRRLEARWLPPKPRARRWLATRAVALAAAAAIAVGVWLGVRSERSDGMFVEALNDHMRVLYSAHPVEIESGGIHQVKPWFAGRVDFAPAIAFAGDADFPLRGGSVAYFVDRKAAAFVFTRRLHEITVLVFPAEGLPWPTTGGEALGAQRVYARTSRGFHTLMWRDGDLGYAAVSDVSESDLRELVSRIESAK
jgi:anti-sigma factor RsiW